MKDRGSRPGSEGGSAALAIPAAVVLVMVVTLGLGDLAAVAVARARAQTAADAAALAAAVEIALRGPHGPRGPRGPDAPSAVDASSASGAPHAPHARGAPVGQARRLAAANGARLMVCRCPADDGRLGAEWAGWEAAEGGWPAERSVSPRARPPARAPMETADGRPANRTVVVRVEVPAPTRLMPGRIRIPAEARADVRSP